MKIKAKIFGYGTGIVRKPTIEEICQCAYVFENNSTKIFFNTVKDLEDAGHELELRLTGSQAQFFLNAFKEAKNG